MSAYPASSLKLDGPSGSRHQRLENRTEPEEVENTEDTGPTISNTASKVLEECVRTMVENLPRTDAQKNESRVKRPMNAFMIYSQSARKAMARHYPTLSYRKLSKALGKIWKVLNAEEKKPFMQEAERLRRKHRQDYPDYKFKPTKTRRARATGGASCSKELDVPNTQVVKMIMKDECEVRPSCQYPSPYVPPMFNLGDLGNLHKGNSLKQTTLGNERQNGGSDFCEEGFSRDFRSIESLPQEEDLASFIDSILSGSSDLPQRELLDTQPNQTSFALFQPENLTVNFPSRNLPGLNCAPIQQRPGQEDGFLSSDISASQFRHEQDHYLYYTEQQVQSLEDFSTFVATDKPVSRFPVIPAPQSDHKDTAKVFINL